MYNFSKMLNDIGMKYFGFEDFKPSAPPLDLAELSQYLVYQRYNEIEEIFYLDDGFLGCFVEVSSIVGISEILERNIKHFFADQLPHGAYFQVTMLASHRISPLLDQWIVARTSQDLRLQKFATKRYEFFKKQALNFNSNTVVRDYRIFISVVMQAEASKFISLKNQVVRKLESLSLKPSTLVAQDLLAVVNEMLQMEKNIAQTSPELRSNLVLKHQCVKGHALPIVEDNGLITKENNLQTKVFQVIKYPESFSLMQMINLLGDATRDSLAIPARFMICSTVAANIRDHLPIITKGRAVINTSEQFYARHNTALQREAAEWVKVIDKINQGSRVLSTSFLVAITTNQQVMEEAENSLISLYHINGWKIRLAKNLQLPCLLAMLPMQAGHLFNTLKRFRLTRLALSDEILATLPLHAEWKGVPVV